MYMYTYCVHAVKLLSDTAVVSQYLRPTLFTWQPRSLDAFIFGLAICEFVVTSITDPEKE